MYPDVNKLILTKSTWKYKFLSTVMKTYLFFSHYRSLYAEKITILMLDATTIALCPKLCRRNVSNPNRSY